MSKENGKRHMPLCTKTNAKSKNMPYVHMIKGLGLMLLSCSLVSACATKQPESMVSPLENQNNIVEMGHRIDSIENRLDALHSSNVVYEVRNKAGKNTGWTAHPKIPQGGNMTAGLPVVPVPANAQASRQGASTLSTPVRPVSSSHVPTLPPSASLTGAAQSPASQRAPLGTLQQSPEAQRQNQSLSQQSAYLPPESPVYPPGQGGQSASGNLGNGNTIPAPVTMLPATTPAPAVLSQPPLPASALSQATPVPVQRATPATSGVKGEYKRALDLVLAGKFQEGRAKFQTFLQNYPNTSLSANAHYWIGETYYAQDNYSDALLSFKQVTAGFPRHDKNADALLKAGMTYQKLGDVDSAAMQYRAVIADFPQTKAARIARTKLR